MNNYFYCFCPVRKGVYYQHRASKLEAPSGVLNVYPYPTNYIYTDWI